MTLTLIGSSISRKPAPPGRLAPTPPPHRSPPTAALLRAIAEADDQLDLVPVGVSLHLFTEAARDHAGLSVVELHRCTTTLTKQVQDVLAGDDRLQAVQRLVTDPDRPARPGGPRVADLCGAAWPAVREVAEQRAAAAVEGAITFGETAILRLAATRAALPNVPWWGTRNWTDLVAGWAREGRVGRTSVTQALRFPETVSDDVLAAILDR